MNNLIHIAAHSREYSGGLIFDDGAAVAGIEFSPAGIVVALGDFELVFADFGAAMDYICEAARSDAAATNFPRT